MQLQPNDNASSNDYTQTPAHDLGATKNARTAAGFDPILSRFKDTLHQHWSQSYSRPHSSPTSPHQQNLHHSATC